jgi:molybdopterin converting factor small subunit
LVRIELYGVPRLRAGRREFAVQASSVAHAIEALERACPALSGAVIERGQLLPAYRISLNGRHFVTDLATPVAAGDSLIVIAADAGG